MIAVDSLCKESKCLLIIAYLFFPLTHAYAIRHDDSVASGKSKGSRQINIGDSSAKINPDVDSVRYLMKGVPMRSSTVPFEREVVSFGPFINTSNAKITITLQHIGGGKNRTSIGIVDGVAVVQSKDSSTFFVPPGSTYGWTIRSEHSITVAVSFQNIKAVDVGMPTENNFVYPRRTGEYRGCVYLYIYPHEGSAPVLSNVLYYYNPSPMSDGSSSWDTLVSRSINFVGLQEGPPPEANLGACIDEYHI
jgi:hypothetical protein